VRILNLASVVKVQEVIKCFRNFINSLIIIITITMPCSAAKADTMDTIISILTGLTCETQGIGNLLRTEFSHTCIPAPMFTFAIANIISPGEYAGTLLRLKINDPELFPDACKRANRIDPNDPKLSFGLCSNTNLFIQRALAIINSALIIAKSLFTGQLSDVWPEILKAWQIPKIKYHEMFEDKKEGESGMMGDIPIPPLSVPFLFWKVVKENDKLCVSTISLFGWIPVGCKYIKEPFPRSIYADFMDLTPANGDTYFDPNHLTACSGAEGCYQKAYKNSKTSIVMTGPLVECVKSMAARLMISKDVCSIDEAHKVLGSPSRVTSSLFQFQVNMHRAVTAMLTLYVILFGMKVVLKGDVPEKTELVNFVIKFLFVTYFSIGINVNGSGNDLDRMDGLIEWIFPFLFNGMTQMASWVISATPSELCRFSPSDYPSGMGHISLWDSLDCRVSHYIGLDIVQTLAVNHAMMNDDFSVMDTLSFPIPPYLYLLIPAFLSGNMTLVALALMYPLMVISVAAFVVNATIVCIISIVTLGILAPLFVPMLLFDYTKGYFDSYVKLMLSFMIQPMVIVTFMTTMLSVYDYGFYGTCNYKSTDFKDGSRITKVFTIDNDWSKYTPDEAEGCIYSLGYILNNPLGFLFGAIDISKATFPTQDDPSRATEEGKYPFLESVQTSKGGIFDTVELVFEKIRKFIISLVTAIFTLYLLYHFSEQLAGFAADMTEGVSISKMAIKPQAIYKGAMKAIGGGKSGGGANVGKMIGRAGGGAKGAADKARTSSKSAGDKVSTSTSAAKDKFSAGANSAKDKFSRSINSNKSNNNSTNSTSNNSNVSGNSNNWKSAKPSTTSRENNGQSTIGKRGGKSDE
jgi:type IV secretion system protein VirB6